jgi:RNA polymerase sigma factor (sigma-70 family)
MVLAVPPPFGFTPAQQANYDSLVPDVPEEAVREILREWGCHEHEDDLRQEVYLGTAHGVRTFDPTKGALRQWVFFSALHAAQSVLRREKRQSSRVVARMWDGLIEYCKHEHRAFPVMGRTDEDDRAALTEVRSRAAAAPLVAVASLGVAGGGEEDLLERATAARCAAALDQALGDLSAPRHELLRSCFADDRSVKEIATARGEKGYRAELVEFHRVVDIVAARLRGMGFRELPPFPPEARGTILRETPPPEPATRT